MNLVKSLRVGLATKGMTQQELAAKALVSIATISKIAKGHQGVSIGIVGMLADSLDLSLSEFIAIGEKKK